jgi:7-carboxy-7-deazaguanine synthase
MQIIEIYKSIQGESSFAGLPCAFVRLAGCNLRCSWCDSNYTFGRGISVPALAILAEIRSLSPNGGLVEITGGEPMLQERELVPFMRDLVGLGYRTLLETSGERSLERVPQEVHKIVDVKCPGSGQQKHFHAENLSTLTERDELKFVLASREDYEYARNFIRSRRLESGPAALLMSPAFRKDAIGDRSSDQCLLDPRALAAWILEDGLHARLGMQIHKFIWEPQLRGV